MKKDLVSIIVPIYNVEKYLKKCIDSLLKQSYSNTEIILIDDGSTDRSPEICDEYMQKDARIKVVHKINGGLSDARNNGIKISEGKYITFVDSDDYLDEHYIEMLYRVIYESNADIVISGIKDYYEGKEIEEDINNINYKILTKEETYKRMLLQQGMDVNACGKLYKKHIFDNLNYPKGMLYEDIQIIDKVIEKSNIITYTEYKGYNYLQRTGSIMYGKMSEKRMSLINKTQELIELMKEKYPKNVKAAIKRYVYCNFHVLGRSILDSNFKNESEKIRKNILNYKKNIFKEKIYTKKEKIATFILIMGLPIYKEFWKIFCFFTGKKNL